MHSWVRRRTRTATLSGALGLASAACLGPNPLLDAGEDTGTDTNSDDVDTTGSESSDGTETSTETSADTSSETGPDHCSNAELDGDESDVDCGGSCSPCEDGQSCGLPEDCLSMVCDADSCQAPSCEDGVQNGDEAKVDCGGSACGFCEHSALMIELDDFEGSNAKAPSVYMFADHSFALSYAGPDSARLRWFDEFAEPMGPSVEVSASLTYSPDVSTSTPIPLSADPERADLELLALVPGLDAMSPSADLFGVLRGPASEGMPIHVNATNLLVRFGDGEREGDTATFLWQASNAIWLRRLDLGIGEGGWLDLDPFEAETMPGAYNASSPKLAMSPDGVKTVAWVRCEVMNGSNCQVVARRFDNDWLDPDPIVVSTEFDFFSNVELARDEAGRSFVVWVRFLPGDFGVRARMLDADGGLDGDGWIVQGGLPVAPEPAVAALSDGSFAVGWDDNAEDRVHLRRYVGPDTPLLDNISDEAPWPPTLDPFRVSMASAGSHLVVVWSATVDAVVQIQGQVLSY